jgi:hypothetical protein
MRKEQGLKLPHLNVVAVVLLFFVSVASAAPGHTKGRPVQVFSPELKPGDYAWHPEVSPAGPVVVFVSLADQVLYVYRNGVEIGRAPVGGIERLSGSHVYSALATMDAAGRRDWISIASSSGRAPNLKELGRRVSIAPEFLANLRALITPGVTLVLTDAPVNADTRSARGFNILTD